MLADGRLTEAGAAQALGWSRARVTARIKLLELPEQAQQLVGAGTIPLSAVDQLRAIGQVSPELLEAVIDFLADGNEWAAERLTREPGWVLDSALREGNRKVFAAHLSQLGSYEIAELRLGKRIDTLLEEASTLHKKLDQYAYGTPAFRFSDEQIDQARAAGVVIEFERGAPVIVDRSLYRELAKDAIRTGVDQLREKAAAVEAERKQARRRSSDTPTDTLEEAQREESRQLREIAERAHGVNLDLGASLLNGLATVDPASMDVARFFVLSLLGSDYDDSPYTQTGERVSRLAMSGIRLVIDEFRTDVTKTLKSGERGRLRIDYGDPHKPGDAIKWMWKFIDGAKTAGELFRGLRPAPVCLCRCLSVLLVRVLWRVAPSTPSGNVLLVLESAPLPVAGCAAIRVRPPGDLGYWSVRDGAYELIPAADTYLRSLRYSRGRALGTTEKYAGNLAVFFDWCATRGLDLALAAGRMDEFVLLLRNELVTRPGSGVGRSRSAGRINHILVSVREMYRSAAAHGVVGEDTIAALFVMGELPDLGFSERRSRRFALRPRHVLRADAPGDVVPVTREEFNALMSVTRCWRDRLLLVLMRHAGLRRGEAVNLCEEDLHFVSDARELGCHAAGAHLHVRRRTTEQGSSAKSRSDRIVPVDAVIVFCADPWYYERERIPGAESAPTVLVNLAGERAGRPLRVDHVNSIVSDLSRRARLDRQITPHMLRHAWATGLAGVADLAVVKDLLGHRHLATTARYVHPGWEQMRAAIDLAYGETLALNDAADADGR